MSDTSLFEIDLVPIGEEGGELRVKNRDGYEVQRQHIVDRSTSMIVQADLVDVVHGKLSDDGDPATLVVLDFTVGLLCFLPNENSQRFLQATIDIHFGDEAGKLSNGPDVISISPKGHMTMRQTSRHVELKRSAQASAQGGGGPASVTGGFAVETTVSQDKQDQTTMNGTIRYEGRPGGGKNAARWVLMENNSQKSGIPSFLRTLILLQREDSKKFTAVVKIATQVDFKAALKSLFGKKDKDDPVHFDPNPEAQPRKSTWAKENQIAPDDLESTNLDKFSIILNTTVRNDVANA